MYNIYVRCNCNQNLSYKNKIWKRKIKIVRIHFLFVYAPCDIRLFSHNYSLHEIINE